MSPAARDQQRAAAAVAAYPGAATAQFDLEDPELMGAIYRDLLRFQGDRSGSGKRVTPGYDEGVEMLHGMLG